MGISIAAITAETHTVEVVYADQTANVVIRPAALTPELESALNEHGDRTSGFVELLAAFLVSWEVLDDAGAPIAPTAENLRKLPAVFLAEVARQSIGALVPKAPTA